MPFFYFLNFFKKMAENAFANGIVLKKKSKKTDTLIKKCLFITTYRHLNVGIIQQFSHGISNFFNFSYNVER